MLAANIRLMAEEDFHNLSASVSLLAVFRLDELAHHGNLKRPHQIGHKHERILQNGQRLDRLSLVVIRDVASEFFHTLLDLLGCNYLAKWIDSRCVHETTSLPTLLLRTLD